MDFNFDFSRFRGLDGLTSVALSNRTLISGTAQVSPLSSDLSGQSMFVSQSSSLGDQNSIIDVAGTSTYNKSAVSGGGNDYIRAGLGSDRVTGGAGADAFAFWSVYEGMDTITDFSAAQGDKIQVFASGFGISANDLSRFSFNSTNGGLFFDSTQLATLPTNSGFSLTNNLSVV